MPLQTGTHTIADLAANTFAGVRAQEFGLERLNDAIQNDLQVHNERVNDMMGDLANISPERTATYGTSASGEAVPADEFTRGPTQKIRAGGRVEFPLEKYQYPIGWTADYLRRATVQDMARGTIAARQAHLARIQRDIRNALFLPTNYTFRDRFVDNVDLQVKRLVNADGGAIPNGPNGEEYNSATHTHYVGIDWGAATAAARAAALRARLQDVIEHGHGDDVRIYINRAQETDIRALDGFAPLLVPNVVPAPGGTAVVGQGTLDITRADNRLIGYFDGFPVWTKPWVVANYIFVFAAGGPNKTLRMRVSATPGEQGLFIAGEIILHPLQARYMEFFHGFGALTRTNGSVLFLGGALYTAPAI